MRQSSTDWKVGFASAAGDAALVRSRSGYEARRTGLGEEFLRAVRALLAGIARNPEQFPVAREDAMVRRFPYVVYFVPEAEHVVVIAVLLGAAIPRPRPR